MQMRQLNDVHATRTSGMALMSTDKQPRLPQTALTCL